jgi:citrate lyase subunit beta / citryl-CoA lyase
MPAQRVHPHADGMMRSLLFVPADQPGKLAKALDAGADALIIDLEDSVAPQRKEAARVAAFDFLTQTAPLQSRPRLIVRVNGLTTGLIDADLDAVVPARPDAVMLPKAEGGVSVSHADAKLSVREALAGLVAEGTIGIVPITTETARSLFVAGSYGDASPRLAALTWGAEDLAAGLGAEASRDHDGQFLDPYRLARALCLAAAAAADVPALDTVHVDFHNEAGLRRECEDARRDGFTGKMAIHPAQVAVINDVFTPPPEAVARAQAVIAAFASAQGAGVVAIDGVMYDRPHLKKAERLLARAKVAGIYSPD